MLAVISLAMEIVNIIPTKASGIGTDGYNLTLLKKSTADRVALYKTMSLNVFQYQRVRFEDMPDDILKFTDEEKTVNLELHLRALRLIFW